MLPAENRAVFSTENLAAVTLDTQRMSLNVRASGARLEVVLDGELALTLRGVEGGNTLNWSAVNAAGEELVAATATRNDGGFLLELPTSTTTVLF